MKLPKKDRRPEGSMLLKANIYGNWSAALCLAKFADDAGKKVSVYTSASNLGIPLQFIEVSA